MSIPFVIPVGTQVVTRVVVGGGGSAYAAGAVGVIVGSPVDATHAYRVRFMDEGMVSMKAGEFVVLRQYQREVAGVSGEGLRVPTIDLDFRRYIILRCVVGSRAYGLETEESDVDWRGVYLPPADLHWGLAGVPEQVEEDLTQEVYWEIEKFLVLGLKSNPNVLEVLWSPGVEEATELGRELIEMRGAFLSKMVYQTYNGYVMSQFKKLSGDLRNKGEVKWKHVMHLIRLLAAGVEILRTGEVGVRVSGELAERLMAVRRGEMEWGDVDRWRLALHEEFDRAVEGSQLPERPDYERVNSFLIKARRSVV